METIKYCLIFLALLLAIALGLWADYEVKVRASQEAIRREQAK